MLTEYGCELARRLSGSRDQGGQPCGGGSRRGCNWPVSGRRAAATAAPQRPQWDSDLRQLRVGLSIVKEFKVPAMNQEIVLSVFEEEHWPPKIDDPLPRRSDIDPQRRLHDTINSLNRRQRHRLLHFSTDGRARGIRWALIEKTASAT